ncbi:MAG: hypothetical protein NVS4B8_05710 [Herpetosiphon sp.]
MRRIRGQGVQLAISLLLALMLWTYVSFSFNPSIAKSTNAALVPINIPAETVLVDPATGLPSNPTLNVTFVVAGSENTINAVQDGTYRAYIDLAGLAPGDHTVPVHVDVPQGLRSSTIKPSAVKIRLEQLIKISVPVVVKQRGQVPFVYNVGTIGQSRTSVLVVGPAPLARAVAEADASIIMQNQTSDLRQPVPLEPVDAHGDPVRGVTLDPPQVDVTVAITLKVQSQQVSVVPNIVGALAPGYSLGTIEWDPKFVQVLSPGPITGTLTTEPISLSGVTGTISRTVGLAPVQNVITDPRNVTIRVNITITALNVQSQLPLLVPIAPINIADGLDAIASPLALEITLAGPFDTLTKLTPGSITAVVDLQGRSAGTYRLPVSIKVPPGLQRVAPATPEVTVTLTSRTPTTTAPRTTTTPTP